jgi:hypothetical protein
MAALIYILKMIIVGGERFNLGAAQGKGLLDLAFFILYVYSYYWFSAPVPADAPFLTLCFWKDLKRWEVRDPSLSDACIKKLDGHTWYVSARNVILALFSTLVDAETKMKIVEALMENPKSEGKFHDQGDAKWIVFRGQLRHHNDTSFGRRTPGRPIGLSAGRPQDVFGGLSYY